MRLTSLFITLILLISCKKEKDEPIPITSSLSNGILVLNEGLFQYNNASLSWVNLSDFSTDNTFFEQKADRYLGDTGNDLKRYGNKIYVVVNVSGTVEVLDALTGKSIKQISFKDGSTNKQPRSITFYGSKAFVSCFDGYVDVVDTVSLQIEKRIKVGSNPDQITASDSKIIVSNSGGLNVPELDSTISIINPFSLVEENKIVVGKNPGDLEVIGNELFVISRGNYSSIAPSLKKVDLTTSIISLVPVANPSILEKMNGKLLIAYQSSNTQYLGLFDASTNNWVANSFVSIADITTLYNIHFESTNQHIYLLDAKGYTTSGKIIEHDQNGVLIRSIDVSLIPNSLIYFP
jgi:hypothetical protein